MRQTFQQKEAEQILQEAVRREVQQPSLSADTPAVSHERLLAMAEELGISPSALEAVLRDRETQAKRDQEQATQAQLRREFITERRAGFLPHLSAFVGVNIFFLISNTLTNALPQPAVWWFIWPLLIWSLGLYFHAVAALPTRGPNFEHAFADWRERRAKRQAKASREQEEEAVRTRVTTTRQAAEAELDG